MKRGWRIPAVLPAIVLLAFLAGCSTGGIPRRVSEPAASLQQLTVQADGRWSIELRLQNYSSIPMRFERVSLALRVGEEAAGTLVAQPDLTIGPESADVVTVAFDPSANARLLLAGRLADGGGIAYRLEGTIDAAPADRGKVRDYEIERDSRLSPVPGLPGVLR
ncbi:LEA type 2 family protein [Luteimonas kalidii]|uniref:LEA type 2 family protein n=1 Tax=Luteimonas kalidii TaxID=3042025 RepID=A0ABT6JY09_9GAMM|nr:LEA type 2 family protein [Luteimonas kalidii]MDH5835584.1 LEA type 2 family protein [Luteimonas kalidii]